MFSRLSALIATVLVAASLVTVPAFAQDAASAPAVAEQTAAPADAAAPAAAPKAEENPYGLMNLVKNGHAVDQFVEPCQRLSTVHVLAAVGLSLDHDRAIARNAVVVQR